MAKKQKFYAVWHGHPPGLYTSWDACQKAIKGVSGAQYKSYASRAEAQRALDGSYKAAVEAGKKQSGHSRGKSELSSAERTRIGEPNLYSIAVDAASSGNPGLMEYRGVDPQTGNLLFHQGPYQQGTNNVGEFLALSMGWLISKKRAATAPFIAIAVLP